MAATAVDHEEGVIGAALLVGRGDRELFGAVLRLAPWTLLGAILNLVAGFVDGARIWLWVASRSVLASS